ncbi:MAG: hypothetical protein J6U35_00445, partial [Clostridia bacterium]|nr:hypothetical protein [Clostridia bacterium]
LETTETLNGYTCEINVGDEEKKTGKLVITFTKGDADVDATASLVISDITTAGNSLYSIEEGEIIAEGDSVYYDGVKFDTIPYIVWGYKYEKVKVTAYHGFMDLSVYKTGMTIIYANDEDQASDAFENGVADGSGVVAKGYNVTSSASVKFTDNTQNGGVVYLVWGLTEESEPVSVEDYAAFDTAWIEVGVELPDDADAPAYKDLESFYDDLTGPSAFDAYMDQVESALMDGDGNYHYVGSSTYFTVPSAIYEYINSDYFANSDLTFSVYYKTPGSDSFTKLSSTSTVKRFELPNLGAYEYYVLATDPMDNSLEIDEEWTLKLNRLSATSELKVYGYFSDDDELMVPVFRFEMGNAGPQVTSADSYQDKGYVGTSYTGVRSFNTKGNDITTVYSLWYNSDAKATAGSFSAEENSGWYDISTEEKYNAVKSTMNWDADFATLAWNDGSLSFTPVAAGSYVVRCMASDGEANTAFVNTEAINVAGAIKEVEIDKPSVWFQENWRSLLFLGIALLSLIGIVILIFVKPKEEKPAEDISAE